MEGEGGVRIPEFPNTMLYYYICGVLEASDRLCSLRVTYNHNLDHVLGGGGF